MTTSHRIEGAATLLSSLSHGGEPAGTVGFLRREKIIGPDDRPVDIPIVSGNSLRGLLRDYSADVMWRSLGSPPLPPQVFHLLWGGGALAKAGAGHVLGARQLGQVRRLIPHVSLFGGSGAGKIMEGKLRVGKLTPICAETAHIVPADLAGPDPASIWEMVQIEEFTRRDDAKRDQLHGAIQGLAELNGSTTPAIGAGTLLTVEPSAPAVEDTGGPAQQMRYGTETLAAGARLHWWMSLRNVTAVETALFAAALEAWSADGGAIGGRSATGHGRIRLDARQWAAQTPTTTIGEALQVAGLDPLTEHVAEHRGEILAALGWFA